MQSLKDKILEGFFTNVGADPIANWINGVFKTVNVRYCKLVRIKSKDDKIGTNMGYSEYNVFKAGDKSLLFKGHRNKIIVNISDAPELLSIKHNGLFINQLDDGKYENIKFLFGQLINTNRDKNTYINNVLLTIDKKTGAIIDKEVIPKFLISRNF